MSPPSQFIVVSTAHWAVGTTTRSRPPSAHPDPDDACDDDAVTDEGTHEVPRCSARGCTAAAAWGLLWNNPRLHTPERRKTWLACEEHRASLSDFLGARNFLRDVVPVSDLPADE